MITSFKFIAGVGTFVLIAPIMIAVALWGKFFDLLSLEYDPLWWALITKGPFRPFFYKKKKLWRDSETKHTLAVGRRFPAKRFFFFSFVTPTPIAEAWPKAFVPLRTQWRLS
jgi:hypothetical protein